MARTDVMIDIETIGTGPGCTVLTVGAVSFDAESPFPSALDPAQTLSLAVFRESCADFGLVENPGTLSFWERQAPEARAAAFDSPGRVELPVALAALAEWYAAQAPDPKAIRVWCHGASFDVPILGAAYDACGMEAPWEFRMLRDTRTVYDLSGVQPDRSSGTHHEALNDALVQARAVCHAFAKLGLGQRFPAAA